MAHITEQTLVVAIAQQISCQLEGETVILHLQKGTYYGLNAVGSRIWELVQEPRRVEEIRAILLQEYDVDPERCTCELLALLRDLADQQLITVLQERPEAEDPTLRP